MPTTPLKERIRWYAHRLRVMHPGEVALRAHRELRDRIEHLLQHRPSEQETLHALGARDPAALLQAFRADALGSLLLDPPERAAIEKRYRAIDGEERVAIVGRAERACAFEVDCFEIESHRIQSPSDWHRDPVTGGDWPLRLGVLIDHNFTGLGGIRYVYELGRMPFLYSLAEAYLATGRERYARAALAWMRSFLDANPYLVGVHWHSSLEAALRLIAWSFTLDALRRSPEIEGPLLLRIVHAIRLHARFIGAHVSRFSSEGNHTVGEATGLLAAATAFRELPESPSWERTAERLLRTMARRQFHPDGVPREQTFHYATFLLDFYFVAAKLLARRRGGTTTPAILEKTCDVLAAVTPSGGRMPEVGDADAGRVLGDLGGPPDPCQSVLRAGAVLFERPDWGPPDRKTLWLVGPRSEERSRAGAPAAPAHGLRTFEDGGYTVFRGEVDGLEEHLLFDHGPLGLPPLRGHGHADALQILLHLGGVPLLIDTGTYRYHGGGPWRRWLRGAAAHNTVTVEGHDLARAVGPFQWTDAYEARLVDAHESGGMVYLQGVETGYRRLRPPVDHGRSVVRFAPGVWLVVDLLRCAVAREACQHFHLAPGRLDRDGDLVTLHLEPERTLHLAPLLRGMEIEVVEGDPDRRGGWHSPAFGVLRPNPTVLVKARGEEIVLATLLVAGRHGRRVDIVPGSVGRRESLLQFTVDEQAFEVWCFPRTGRTRFAIGRRGASRDVPATFSWLPARRRPAD